MRVAVGMFNHETNTFAPTPADMAAFEARGGGVRIDPPLSDILSGNWGYAGFAQAARDDGWTVVPLTFAMAVPANRVTTHAFETILGAMLAGLRRAQPLDAVFLDLHGAMVTEEHDSGDAEILRRVRAEIGPQTPLLVEFDYHANIPREAVSLADAIFVYRTYPHTDMAERGRAAAAHLRRMREGMPRQAVAFREIAGLLPITAQSTLTEPMKGAFAKIRDVEGRLIGNGMVSAASMAAGFPNADAPASRPSVLAYADTQSAADAAADYLAAALSHAVETAHADLLAADEAVTRALAATADGGVVVLADVQDNPGGGGEGDTTGLLRALIAAQAPSALLAHLTDPIAAAAAHAAGVGATLSLAIGAGTGGADGPVEGVWTVEQLNDGRAVGAGPMAYGWAFTMGPSAMLRQGGVRVLVVSQKEQCLD
ncbi:MAG: M81 family metallopeptidase, partial [Hyphomonadaceae bacterium]